jgi:hypothetical protein
LERLIKDLNGGFSIAQSVIDENNKAVRETEQMYQSFKEFEERENNFKSNFLFAPVDAQSAKVSVSITMY